MPEKRHRKPMSQWDPMGSTPYEVPERVLNQVKEELEVRRTTVRWITADGSEHGVESDDSDEITVRCLVLLLKWQKGEVVKIRIEE